VRIGRLEGNYNQKERVPAWLSKTR